MSFDRCDNCGELWRTHGTSCRPRLPAHATDQAEREADEALAAALDPNHELNRRAIARMSDDEPEDSQP